MKNARPIFRLLLGSLVLASSAIVSAQTSCEKLSDAKIAGATIIFAQTVAAGTFAGPPTPNSGRDLTAPYKNVPAFCRVVALAKPTADSEIRIEIWMPSSGWNSKLQGLGNGGFAGQIDFTALAAATTKGYAATATDTGHSGSPIDATWALGHPEKVVDFGHRGIHEMTRVAKETVRAFYGKSPQHAYFAGCSDGGREALMEAQRYPADYDGILAGAPANYWTALLSTAVYDTQALTLDAASFIPPAKIPAISAAVIAACDGLDGVHDGILSDPRQCKFDPAQIQCKAGDDTDKCLTAPQAAALKKIYGGTLDSHGHQVFPGFLPGAEEGEGGWGLWITGPAPEKGLVTFFGRGYFSNMVYEKSDWDYKTFTVDAGLKAAEEKTAAAVNAVDADLRPFQARGGKLIVYHGWDDPAIPAINSVNYYQSVAAKMGQRDADSFMRLYMVSGMQHCGGGPGADSFGHEEEDAGQMRYADPRHSVAASLEQWVEKKTAPGAIIASKYAASKSAASKDASGDEHKPSMTRPLCAYPRAAKYKGTGDTKDAANFVCEEKK